jgi:ABC-type transport system substrate-binding protein
VSWLAAGACGERGTATPAGRDGTVAASVPPGHAGRAPRARAGDAGTAEATGGTVVVATGADAETLFPPLAVGLTARQVTDLLFEPLAELGDELNTVGDAGFRPRLARAWTWAPDSLSIAFHLDPRAHWHDGAPCSPTTCASPSASTATRPWARQRRPTSRRSTR